MDAVAYTELFTRLGKLVKSSDALATLPTTLRDQAIEILGAYGTSLGGVFSKAKPIEGLASDYDDMRDVVTSWRDIAASYANKTVTDYDLVISKIPGLSRDDLTTVLSMLLTDMYNNSQSVKGSTAVVGAVSVPTGAVNKGNSGSATNAVLLSKVLDGYNSPLTGGMAHFKYTGLNSELVVPVTHVFTCVQDSYADGLTAGEEIFSWTDGTVFSAFDYRNEGIGDGPTLTVANADSTVQNRNFEDFATTNTPDNWTLGAGTVAGTNCFKETSLVFRGTGALKFTGNATATIQVSQSITSTLLKPLRKYHFSIRLARSGTVPTQGTVEALFTGTGYTAAASEKVSVTALSLNTAYGTDLYTFELVTPQTIPTDLALVLRVTGTLTTGTSVVWDSLAFAPTSYHGGISAIPVAGATPWTRNDQLQVTATNDDTGNLVTGGLFQRFARKWWKMQFRSKLDGSETIFDTLAQ